MKKKMKRYENGGEIESMQGQNPGIDDDTRARAKAYVAGTLQDETGKESKVRRNTETGELYDTEDSFKPVPKSMPVTETKAKTESKKETKKESKPASNKPDSVSSGGKEGKEKTGFQLKKEAALARSDAEPSATKTAEARKSPSFSDFKESIIKTFSFPKSQRTTAAAKGMKSGGKVSSASKRADGIAQRGKTRA